MALPANQLERLEEIENLFAPIDPAERVAWLFNESHPDIPLSSNDFQALDVERKRLRAEAVEEIWEAGGVEVLMSLRQSVVPSPIERARI